MDSGTESLAALYAFAFEDGSALNLDKAFDGDFDTQKQLELEFNESEDVIEAESSWL